MMSGMMSSWKEFGYIDLKGVYWLNGVLNNKEHTVLARVEFNSERGGKTKDFATGVLNKIDDNFIVTHYKEFNSPEVPDTVEDQGNLISVLRLKDIDIGQSFYVLGEKGIYIKLNSNEVFDVIRKVIISECINFRKCVPVEFDVMIEPKQTRLYELDIGDVFDRDGILHMKVGYNSGDGFVDVYDLKNRRLCVTYSDVDVIPINGTIKIVEQ